MRSRVQLDDGSRTASRPLYDEDFALWIEEQMAALRSGDVGALDLENLIEELEGLTKRDERTLGSQLKRIMAHVLKQRHQPERASRSWEDSISNAREEIADILEQSPSLRRLLPSLMIKNYPRVVAQAARDTRLTAESFPPRPPFSSDEVLGDGRQAPLGREGAHDTANGVDFRRVPKRVEFADDIIAFCASQGL